jgi:hypothetical protein
MAPGILNFGQDGSERLGSCPSNFTSGKKAPGIHYVGDSVDPRAALHVSKKQNSHRCQDSSSYFHSIITIIVIIIKGLGRMNLF